MAGFQMYHIGIRPEEYKVVVCKGVNSPIAAYEPLTPDGGIIFANTPGVTTADLSTFAYQRRARLYPFEMDVEYEFDTDQEEAAMAVAAVEARL